MLKLRKCSYKAESIGSIERADHHVLAAVLRQDRPDVRQDIIVR